jgi:hypothetical protein
MDDSGPMEFADVSVISASRFILTCRVGERVVAVRPASLLPGTTVQATGDRGLLVLSRAVAISLGLASRR